MQKRFGSILALIVSLMTVSTFADTAREEEKQPESSQEEVASVDDVQPETHESIEE